MILQEKLGLLVWHIGLLCSCPAEGGSAQSFSVHPAWSLLHHHMSAAGLPLGKSVVFGQYGQTKICFFLKLLMREWEQTGGGRSRDISAVHGVQVAGGGGGSLHGQVDIFSLNRTTPRLVKSIPLRSPVLCLELVREPGPRTDEEEEEKESGRVTRAENIICVGLQDGRSVPLPAAPWRNLQDIFCFPSCLPAAALWL